MQIHNSFVFLVYRKKWRHAPVLLLGHVYRWWWHARPSVHPHRFLGLCCVRIQILTQNQYYRVLNWYRWILARVSCKNAPACECILKPMGSNIDQYQTNIYLKHVQTPEMERGVLFLFCLSFCNSAKNSDKTFPLWLCDLDLGVDLFFWGGGGEL